MAMRRKILAGTVAALAVGGAGAGYAATQLANPSPGEESKAIVDDAARSLGIEPARLDAALKKAMEDRIDAAVADGRLTKQQGEMLKKRIESNEFPLFGPPAFGFGFGAPHPFFHGLDAAATYLGLTDEQLHRQLASGKTLAQLAKAKGKSVDGLEAALLKDVQAKLDTAVKAGRLTKAKEQQVLADLRERIDDLVNGQLRFRFREKGSFGFRGDRGFGFGHPGGPPVGPASPTLDPAA
jgi:polyhydroxyalkanoate synthesis regulator phasin